MVDPMVCSAAVSASFACAETLDDKSRYINIVQSILSSPPIIKIHALQAIIRTYSRRLRVFTKYRLGIQPEGELFPQHERFQILTLQLIQSMLQIDIDLSSLLIDSLCSILRLDPCIIYSSASSSFSAMDIAFQFLVTLPANPKTRFTLCDTIDFILKKLWFERPETKPSGGKEMEWLSKVVEMVHMASQKDKGDALVTVCFPQGVDGLMRRLPRACCTRF